jgi:hypothetical protein
MDLREIRWEGVNFMHVTQDRDQWLAVVNRGSVKLGEFLDYLSDCWLLKKISAQWRYLIS